MKRNILVFGLLLILGSIMYASPIAFGLDSSFNIPYLIANDFKLEINEHGWLDTYENTWLDIDEDDWIIVKPPLSKKGFSDRNISYFGIFCLEGSDNWLSAVLAFDEKSSYETTYNFVSRNYGEGMSAKNTSFFAEWYSQEISEDMLLTKMVTGDFSDFFVEMFVASILNDLLYEATTNNINMWITEDLYIFTLEEITPMVFFFNKETIKNAMNLYLAKAFSFMMY